MQRRNLETPGISKDSKKSPGISSAGVGNPYNGNPSIASLFCHGEFSKMMLCVGKATSLRARESDFMERSACRMPTNGLNIQGQKLVRSS